MELGTCVWPLDKDMPPGLGLLPREGLSGVWGGFALLAGDVAAEAPADAVELAELLEPDPELELELLPPPHRAFVTRSITDVLPLDAGAAAVVPGVEAASPDPLPLWWCFERNPSPLMRLDSSAEARSTTPCAEIDDMVCWNRFTLPAQVDRPSGKAFFYSSLPLMLT